ncbi:MAG: ATP synthase F1 subunit delta [Ignavibacteriales bacterium]|nr:ATP synthase F1 subunit delta [Ignavibacteriales bacterium]
MKQLRVARRYAEAVMGLAEEQKKLDRVAEDFQALHRILKESREFVAFLRSPVVTKEKKKAAFAELSKNRFGDLTLHFFNMLVEKGREDALTEILEQFFTLRDDKLGIVTVEVKAATDLSKEQHDTIARRFEGITKKKVRVTFSLDKGLKGGFVAKVGDTVFDGSIRRQLELMRQRFAEGGDGTGRN